MYCVCKYTWTNHIPNINMFINRGMRSMKSLILADAVQRKNLEETIHKNLNDFEICKYSEDENIIDTIVKDKIGIVIFDDSYKSNNYILSVLNDCELPSNVYTIVLTQLEELDRIEIYIKNGADYCLKKPLNEMNLIVQLIVAKNTINDRLSNAKIEQAYSNLKDMQMRLIQAEKLAGIGRLAAGIAHEINNPLGFVSGNTEVLEKYINRYESILELLKDAKNFSDEECVKVCQEIAVLWKSKKIDRIRNDMGNLFSDTKDGLNRISVIVTGLKNFSRVNQQDEKGLFDLNDGIHTTLIVARNELKYNCEVDFQPGDIPSIFVNGGQINQVILNMLINAAYAIKEKYNKEKGNIVIKTYRENDYVCCSIKDDGCGMNESTINHIFEPFFSTKPVGVGTGLGMGIAYDYIFVKHNGIIDIKSELGKGTEFIIKLPEKLESFEEV